MRPAKRVAAQVVTRSAASRSREITFDDRASAWRHRHVAFVETASTMAATSTRVEQGVDIKESGDKPCRCGVGGPLLDEIASEPAGGIAWTFTARPRDPQ